jgi:hypothetical protein
MVVLFSLTRKVSIMARNYKFGIVNVTADAIHSKNLVKWQFTGVTMNETIVTVASVLFLNLADAPQEILDDNQVKISELENVLRRTFGRKHTERIFRAMTDLTIKLNTEGAQSQEPSDLMTLLKNVGIIK